MNTADNKQNKKEAEKTKFEEKWEQKQKEIKEKVKGNDFLENAIVLTEKENNKKNNQLIHVSITLEKEQKDFLETVSTFKKTTISNEIRRLINQEIQRYKDIIYNINEPNSD